MKGARNGACNEAGAASTAARPQGLRRERRRFCDRARGEGMWEARGILRTALALVLCPLALALAVGPISCTMDNGSLELTAPQHTAVKT
jgi:hypothetical protein